VKRGARVFLALRALSLCLLLSACAAPPTPFQVGAEVPPPAGCIEYRTRGGRC